MAFSRKWRLALKLFVSLVVLCLITLATAFWLLRGSLAQLNGSQTAKGLEQTSVISRDKQGIVTLKAKSRNDIAYSLGFVHAQERFFQMDLLRRNSAGELSELFGERARQHDTQQRIHQFRKRAEAAFDASPETHQQLIQSYTKGVNLGIKQLRSRPLEYHFLQKMPERWQPADTFLVVLSMYMDLQDEWGQSERSLTAFHDLVPSDWFTFLRPLGGQWDATLDGGDAQFTAALPQMPLASFQNQTLSEGRALTHYADEILPGSNNWSVSGQLTEHGSALVADDMHLGLDVPNIWFRASWFLPSDGRRVTGATLPGTPLMIIGSNERIAWGFTNSYGDFSDLIRLQTNAEQSEYLTPDGWQPFTQEQEIIHIKGQNSQATTIKKTIWGPVIGEDHYGNALVLRWVAHDIAGLNLNLFELEYAKTAEEALNIAQTTGIPGQNLNVGDDQGNIGWSIMGAIPKRFGYTSVLEQQLSADWSKGDKGWLNTIEQAQYPQVLNPENQRLWTANARMISGDAHLTLGDGMGAMGPRQQQIRDRLFEKQRFTEADFLAIQLDDEALFLTRWQQVLLDQLSDDALAKMPKLTEFKAAVINWQGRASADSVGYLLVKRFRERVIDQTVGHVFRFVEQQTGQFWASRIDNQVEYPVWALITEQPEAHIPQGFTSWDDFLLSMAIAVNIELTAEGKTLASTPWGKANTVSIRHPLSQAVPFLSSFLDMPTLSLPGDTYMPRVQGQDFGASQRMAVAPGHEQSGYFHMATGQSGHPLSPFYRAGHLDWVNGNASAFLPGETKYELELVPEP